MWIERLTASRTTQACELAARFAERRHTMLAENLANVDTPDYPTQQLDPQRFQASLASALDRAKRARQSELVLRGNAQFQTGARGQIEVRPEEIPPRNVLFHDGTNVRLERLMTDIAQNQLSYDLAVNLLRGRYGRLLAAIRGRVT